MSAPDDYARAFIDARVVGLPRVGDEIARLVRKMGER
jgi:hypothetical protein